MDAVNQRLRNQYWDNVGLFEYAVQLGAKAGIIEGSEAKRVIRMVESQPDNLFFADVMASGDVIKDPSQLKTWVQGISSKGAAAQQGANYAPRIEGHHPISVSSTQAAAQHLPIRKAGEFIDGLYEDGIPVGTIPEHMVPLSKNAHTGNAPIAAHMDPVTGNIDEGVWQGIFNGKAYGDDVEYLKDAFLNESGSPQMMLAERASMQPGEVDLLNSIAEIQGVSPHTLMDSSNSDGKKTVAAKIKKDLKAADLDIQGLSKLEYGEDKAQRGGKKTSNNSLLTADRPEANIGRRNAGLSGNEELAQDTLGKWVMNIRSNNPRRRL